MKKEPKIVLSESVKTMLRRQEEEVEEGASVGDQNGTTLLSQEIIKPQPPTQEKVEKVSSELSGAGIKQGSPIKQPSCCFIS